MAGMIGHNRPPTPFDEVKADIDNLAAEARQWLDGDPIITQGQADGVAKLITDARAAKKRADEARKIAAKPFDDGKKAVQAQYTPILKTCDAIASSAKAALSPFLAAQEAEKREAAEAAQRKADALALEARRAHENATHDDMAAVEAAEQKITEAKEAKRAASAAQRDRAQGKGGGRAITSRVRIVPEIVDLRAAAAWIWKNEPQVIRKMVEDYAAGSFRAKMFEIDGVEKREERNVA